MKSHTKLRAGIIGIGLTFFILLRLLSAYPDIVETYYSNGIYPVLKAFVSFPTGQFQFSISEFLIFFLVLICAPLYIRRIFKKKIRLYRILLNFTTFTALIYIWFSLFWGINYFRLPLEEIHFFSLDKDQQLDLITNFVKTCHVESEMMRTEIM